MNTQNLVAYIRGNDIASSKEIKITAKTLAGAKRQATEHFGAGFNDHTIVIAELHNGVYETISERRISEKKWFDL